MNLKKAFKEFWTPRFTTFELEHSRTRCRANFEIMTIIYDDDAPKMPFRIMGFITTNMGIKRPVCWNQFGECFFEAERLDKYDLVHPAQKEIDSAKTVMICAIGIILTLIATIIWN